MLRSDLTSSRTAASEPEWIFDSTANVLVPSLSLRPFRRGSWFLSWRRAKRESTRLAMLDQRGWLVRYPSFARLPPVIFHRGAYCGSGSFGEPRITKWGGMSMILSGGEKGGTWGPRDVAEVWDRGAQARARAFGVATERMLDLANVTQGVRVIDIAAGAGDQALMAARRVGPTGYVLATDIASSMVDLAAAAANRAGVTNVGTRVMDAQRLEVEAESFDAVISRFGLMLIPDPHKALAEIRRVLRGGGKVAAIVFSTPDQCPFLSIPHSIARRAE